MCSGIVWAAEMLGSITFSGGDVAKVVGTLHGPMIKKQSIKKIQ